MPQSALLFQLHTIQHHSPTTKALKHLLTMFACNAQVGLSRRVASGPAAGKLRSSVCRAQSSAPMVTQRAHFKGDESFQFAPIINVRGLRGPVASSKTRAVIVKLTKQCGLLVYVCMQSSAAMYCVHGLVPSSCVSACLSIRTHDMHTCIHTVPCQEPSPKPTCLTSSCLSLSMQGCWQLAGGHGREVYDGLEVRGAWGVRMCLDGIRPVRQVPHVWDVEPCMHPPLTHAAEPFAEQAQVGGWEYCLLACSELTARGHADAHGWTRKHTDGLAAMAPQP